jgi:polygalacturonase
MTRIAVDVRKNFYAVGDGIADDTISIQNAINSGLPVFIPPGRYKKRKQLICLQMIFLERVLQLLT